MISPSSHRRPRIYRPEVDPGDGISGMRASGARAAHAEGMAVVSTWTTVLGKYPHTNPLRDGRVTSPALSLEFQEFDAIIDAFTPMVMEQKFDVCELALATFLQAHEYGKPIVLLPIETSGGTYHERIQYWPSNGDLAPEDLKGRRVGVRSYGHTAGMWVRGILWEEYGLGYGDIDWVTIDGPQVEDYVEPPFVSRAPEGASLDVLLKQGDLAATVATYSPEATPLIPNADVAKQAWVDRHRTVGIGHMIVIDNELANDDPVLVRELCALFEESCRIGDPHSRIRFGFDRVRPAVRLAIEYALEQRLISSAPRVEELFPSYLLDT